jgi:RimJ/RimL family protein N-acetyltransferase
LPSGPTPRVTAFTGSVFTLEQIETAFHEDLKKKDTAHGFRTVIETESGLHVGDCGLLQKEIEVQAEVELVCFFHPLHWGKGFATEAASALRDQGLNDLGLPRLISLIHRDDGASGSGGCLSRGTGWDLIDWTRRLVEFLVNLRGPML